MQYDYDVIVVGGGAGGATFAYACARAGKSVLLLERGNRYTTASSLHDEQAMLIDKRPYDDREVDVNGKARRLYMGGVLGGGTSLYGGALVRPSEQDFQPGQILRQADSPGDLGMADLLRRARAVLHRGRTALWCRGPW